MSFACTVYLPNAVRVYLVRRDAIMLGCWRRGKTGSVPLPDLCRCITGISAVSCFDVDGSIVCVRGLFRVAQGMPLQPWHLDIMHCIDMIYLYIYIYVYYLRIYIHM